MTPLAEETFTGRWYKYIPGSTVIDAVKERLAKEFPGVEFTFQRYCTRRGSDCVNISWEDGPSAIDVEEITLKYEGLLLFQRGSIRLGIDYFFLYQKTRITT